jgi:hypothetical protein
VLLYPTTDLFFQVQVQVQVILRPTVSRPVCLGVGLPPGVHDQSFITVEHLRSKHSLFPSTEHCAVAR